ncbi:hypothetical protein HBH1_03402 [Herbaspirillum sp. BH-1]|uniref:DUF2970 domain-containing protein n=2 Tax=Herbaspirillum frisingense TaxID=92645 RepID=A0AAI9II50_9BURK|nr:MULTISPECIES: DUF2970 domain-containing protein [Herbaspirillum]EOA06469.1 hypothetical protein HFRIS_001879 [Herbaspirillum frisingense GSF30]MCI1012262.1 DUF2970 domain-containing protein [Herbaspirillum sp. C7C2]MDR6584588.1 preprotein translocase subunit Sec61beta [Herbaspirillum frisingense]ONN66803.1 hypothetical protein BTM36_09700 [Herbaspirillum sp. VT-16-41]PLY58335.1 hypothetical protein HBH1_03402 [Herbaspirillum sp. BH-1]
MDDELKQAAQRKASFGATMKAVFWSFFGVRKRKDYESDAARLNPVHVIIAGILGAAIFIAILVTIVKLVVASAAGG